MIVINPHCFCVDKGDDTVHFNWQQLNVYVLIFTHIIMLKVTVYHAMYLQAYSQNATNNIRFQKTY